MAEGLSFLHNSVKIVHRAVTPENIVLNHQGAWKLFGFDFCVANQSLEDQQVVIMFAHLLDIPISLAVQYSYFINCILLSL